jgi:low temperature requirement protein LtrA
VHLAFFAATAVSTVDRELLKQLARFGVVTATSVALMIGGAALGGGAQLRLWLAAVATDYVGTQAIGAAGWRLYAPGHFSERHGLIVLIALGESIVAIGVGTSELPVATALVIAAALGIVLVATLWWVYFDITALAAERRLAAAEGVERAALARDSYTYLHLPMIAGVVFRPGVEEGTGLRRGRRRPRLRRPVARHPAVVAARRAGALPARAGGLPVAQRPLAQPAPDRGGARPGGRDPAG